MRRPNPKIKSARARYNKGLGDAVFKARQRKGLSIEALAQLATTSKSSIFYIESGERCPSVHLLDRIANALDTTVADLLT